MGLDQQGIVLHAHAHQPGGSLPVLPASIDREMGRCRRSIIVPQGKNMEDRQDVRGHADKTAVGGSVRGEAFDVRFRLLRGQQYARRTPARFQGKGCIVIDEDGVAFEGKRRGLARRETFIRAPTDLFNVARMGKSVRFNLRSPTEEVHVIELTAANEAAAVRLESRLPKATTPEFEVAVAERSDFHARLDQLSPHAPVVPVLVAINVAVFLAMCVAGVGIITPDGAAVVHWGSNYGPLTTSGQWWRLVSNIFVHFGILHIALNMWALYATGRTVERMFGSARFALLYLFAGVAASMASLLWNPGVNSAGASGAIFGVFGGMLAFVLNPRNAVPRSVMVEHRNSTLAFAAYTLFYGMVHAGIDNAAHIGGLIAGLAMGSLLARPLTSEGRRTFQPGRLAIALASGAILLAALGWPLAHPGARVLRERQFALVRGRFGADEAAAVDATKRLAELANAGRLSREQLLALLAGDVTPKWSALYDEVAAPPLVAGDRDFALQQQLLRYLDARRKQFILLGQSVRANAPALKAQADDERAQAEQALAELKASSGHPK